MIKTKFLRKLGVFALVFAALASLGSGFFVPKTASADQEIYPNDLVVQQDVFINGQANNYIRVGKDGNFKIAGTIRLVSPESITFNNTDIASGPWNFNPELKDFLIGIKNVKDVGDFKCNDTSTGNVTFMSCKFPVPSSWGDHWSNRTDTVYNSGFRQGTILPISDKTALLNNVEKNTYTIGSSQLNSLGISTSSPQGVTHEIYIYPLFMANGTLTNYPVAFKSLGKKVTVIYYDTQAQAQEAENNQGRPQGVEGYGSTSGNMSAGQTGDGIIGFLNWIIAGFLGLINEVIYFFFYWLVTPLIQAMLSIHTYTDTFASVIYPGWEIVRNVCNMLFIIALIAIALATLFRVESYHFRQLLVQLVVAALMVNFSLAIAQVVLGIADTVQNQFLPNNMGVIRSLGRDLMVSNTRSAFLDKKFTELGQFSETVKLFFYVSMAMGSFVVFAAIAVFLAIRMVMLWILLMLSPIPYVAGILPATAQYRKMWWDNFIKYAFFTPIMAFFLNLSAIIASKTISNPILQTVGSKNLAGELGGDFSEFVFKIGSNILLLMFLFASIKIADLFGIAGAHTATEIAQKGLFLPFKGAKWAAGRTFEGIQNKTGITMDPRLWASAWKEEMDKRKHQRLEKRMGATPLGKFGKKLGLEGVPLGSPRDMLANYASWAGAERALKNTRFFGGGRAKDWMARATIAEERAKILTDTARREIETQKDTLKSERQDLFLHNQITTERAQVLISDLNAKIKKNEGQATELREEEVDLRKRGQIAEADKIKVKAEALENKALDWNEWAKQLGYQVAAVGPGGTIDVERMKASLATRTTGRRVVMTDDEYKNEVFDKDKTIRTLDGEIIEQEAKIVKDDRRRIDAGMGALGAAGSRPVDEAFINSAKAQAKDFRQKSAERKTPEAYYARQARLHGESDEMKKIADIEDTTELSNLFANARAQGDAVKAVAIAKKMAKDGNFNNLLNDMGYEASLKGMKDFFSTEIQGKLKVDHHETMQIASEVGYMNEHNKQWGIARVVKVTPDGHLDWATEKEHATSAAWEARKQHAQNAVRTNPRFAYINEDPEGHRTFHDAGIELLKSYNIPSGLREIDGNFNIAALEAITSVPDWQNNLMSRGVPQAVVAALEKGWGKKKVK